MGKKSREKLARRNLEEGVQEREKPEFQSGLEKICLFIIRWGTYLVLFTPLIINLRFFFPFVAPKTVFFRIIVEIILAAYILLVIANRRYRPRINALTVALALFLAVFILASFTGINLERSFWSTHERMTGILTMLHLFAFFLILTGCFKQRKDWERFLGISVIVGVILSIYILLGNEISTRGGGTIGNTSFMAAYLLFDIFFAVTLLLAKRGVWQIFAGLSLAIMLPVLFTSSARGANLAFWLGLFLLALGYLLFSQKKILKRLALGFVLTLVIAGIVLAVIQPPLAKDKVANTVTEMKSRLVNWEKGWQGFRERPILGWGPENYNVVFNKYFNPCMFTYECGGEIWFDRVHNIIFDTLVATGLLGLLSYLAIFGLAISGLLRVLPKIVERRNLFFPLGMTVLLVVYFIQNLLVFDMINTYLVFFLSLAFIGFLIHPVESDEVGERYPKRFNPIFGAVIIIVMAFILWTCNIQPAASGYYIVKMLASQDVASSTMYFQKSLDSWMNKYESREQFAQKMSRASRQEIKDGEVLEEAFTVAETEMEKSIEENSLDFRHHLFLGELYTGHFRLNGDEGKIVKAEEILEKAAELSRTNQQSYWYLAEVKTAQGKVGEAISFLQKAVELEPQLGISHWYLAMGYKIAGEYELALEEIDKAEKVGNEYSWKDSLDNIKRVIEIHQILGQDPTRINDDANLIQLYLKVLESEPENIQALASLAASYANLGEYDKAREVAMRMMEIDPSLQPKIEELLKSFPE